LLSRQSAPSNLIGASGFAVQDQSQSGAPVLRLGPGGHARTPTHFSPALRVFTSRSLRAGSARAWREPQASRLETLEKFVAASAERNLHRRRFHRPLPFAVPPSERRPYAEPPQAMQNRQI
jgi:hypothetical protein